MTGAVRDKEVHVGRSPYQSEKRRKELARLKKQEEKRQRRFNKKHEGENAEGAAEGAAAGETDAMTPEGVSSLSVEQATSESVPPKEDQGNGQPPA
jgi:hypothetical protein